MKHLLHYSTVSTQSHKQNVTKCGKIKFCFGDLFRVAVAGSSTNQIFIKNVYLPALFDPAGIKENHVGRMQRLRVMSVISGAFKFPLWVVCLRFWGPFCRNLQFRHFMGVCLFWLDFVDFVFSIKLVQFIRVYSSSNELTRFCGYW